MIQVLRPSNVHAHGVIHAFGMTVWMLLCDHFLLERLEHQHFEILPEIYWISTAVLASLYLLWAVYLFTNVSGKNTILRNLHTGIVLSFIHPFVYAFVQRIVRYGEFSIYGVSIHYIVFLMILSIPVAALVYLFVEYSKEEKSNSKDLLDDDFREL